MPEEPLLGDALGHPAHRARLDASQPALVVPLHRLAGPPEAAFALRLGEHLAKPPAQPAEEAARPGNHPPEDAGRLAIVRVSRRVSGVGVWLVRHLTIELVTVGADGNQVDIHY